MTGSNVSARIILGIVLVVIALVILWRHWSTDLLAFECLVGAALLVAGIHLIWLEVEGVDQTDTVVLANKKK